MYDDAAAKIDEIAERILMLDGVPAHNFSKYLQLAKVQETAYVTAGDEGLKNIIETISYFIASERAIIQLAQENNDEATLAQMSDYIKEQEKFMWMMTAYYSK